jgi:hypothetical protein
VSEKRDLLQPEITLAELGIQLMFTELLQHQPQVFFMFFLTPIEYQYIINEYHNKLSRYSMNTLFIKYMKYAGVLVKPKDITVNSYNPYLDVNVVFGISSTRIFN